MPIPQASAMRASRGALRLRSSHPVRIFRVTGRSTALTVASRMRAAWASSRINARLAPGQLHGHRLLVGAALGHGDGLTGLADHRFAGDHLGNDEPGAEALY